MISKLADAIFTAMICEYRLKNVDVSSAMLGYQLVHRVDSDLLPLLEAVIDMMRKTESDTRIPFEKGVQNY